MTSRTNSGFTLMEMMLVLAILVIAGAIVLPAMRGPMDDLRLREAGELVRAQWDRGRVKAMKTGCIYVFRYELGGDAFSLQPWQGDTSSGTAQDQTQATPAATAVTPTDDLAPNRHLGIRGAKLPSGIKFYTGTTEMDARSAQVTQDTGGSQAGDTAAGGWSQPIVFYPDGTSSQARVVLTNERFFVQLQLRGLTGTALGSDLLTEQELTPATSR
jgi:prepilin-type N-terminal cleavage/methylation domain-containing protein